MTDKPKRHTLDFYKLSMSESVNLSQAETALCNFFTSKQNPTPNAPIADYKIQLQDIVEYESMGCSLVSGVVKKFRTVLPMTGVVGQTSEKKMELKKNEFPVERTHFIYNLSNNVLLYQDNPQGTTCGYFKTYLITQRDAFPGLEHVSFNFVPMDEVYKMLERGDISVKKIKIHIPHLTTIDLFSSVTNPSLIKALELMDNLGGDLDLSLNEKKNKSLINPEISEFLRSFREMFNNGPKPTGTRGTIEIFNEDDTIYPIDLLKGGRLSTITKPITMSDEPSQNDNITKAMKKAFSEKQDILDKLYKRRQIK